MANAILKITVFRRNIRMGRINRQDPILLECNNSNYSIEKNLRIYYLISQIFPNEDSLNYTIPNILSNESFGFLQEDKIYLNNNDNEDLNIPSNIIINEDENDEDEDEDENENTINIISTILNNQHISKESNNTISTIDTSITTDITTTINTNNNYQTSSNFLLSRTNIYPTTKNFNNVEHIALKNLYKDQFLGIINDINITNWKCVEDYWKRVVDKDAKSNSTDKIRPKSLEDLKAHLLILENYYLRKKIEENTLIGNYY